MGPPIFIGGNPTVAGVRETLCVASMGPPIFIGGNNGATRVDFPET